DGVVRWIASRSRLQRDATGRAARMVGVNMDVTERKQAEDVLRESERRFREMIDALPAAIYTTDAAGRLTHFNPAAVEFSGRVPELGSDHWCVTWKLYYPDGTPMPHDECPMAIALKSGRAVRGAEAIAERPDGRRIWFEPYPTPFLDSAGRVVGGINMLVDITERKRAENALRKSEERFRNMANIIPSIVWTADTDGTITYANDQWFSFVGITPEENARGWPELVLHPDDYDLCVRAWNHALQTGSDYEIEVRNRRHDGEYRWFLTRARPTRDESGRVTAWFGVTTDIHESKHLEAALRESEERFRNIAETGNDGIWQVDAQARTLYANEYMAELLGCSLAELHARRMTDFCFEEDLLVAQARILANLNGQQQEFDFRFRRLDGTAVLVLAGTSPVYDRHGAIIGALGMFSDITERKRAERRNRYLAEATHTLTESLDMQRTLQEVARLAVPDLADWCTLNLLQPDGSIALAAAAHRDPEQEAMLWSLAQRYPLQMDAADGTPHVIRTGTSELHRNFREEWNGQHGLTPPEWLNESQLHSLLIVPLSTHGRSFGALTLASIEPGRRFDYDDLALAEEIARRAALVMENAQLFRDEQEARQIAEQDQQRISSLQVVTAALSEAATPADVVDRVIRLGATVLGIRAGNINLISPDGNWIDRYAIGYSESLSVQHERLPIHSPTAGAEVCRGGAALWFESHDDFAARYPHLARQREATGNQAAVIVPLEAEGRRLGALAFSFPQVRSFSPEDRGFILTLALQCTQALERARLFEAEGHSRRQAELSADRIASLQVVTAALSEAATPAQVIESVIRRSATVLGIRSGSIKLISSDGQWIDRYALSYPDGTSVQHERLAIDAPTPGADVCRTGEAVWLASREAFAARYPTFAQPDETADYEAAAIVPLQTEGRRLGALSFRYPGAQSFSEEDREFILTLAGQCAQALERARLFEAELLSRKGAERATERVKQLQNMTAALARVLTVEQVLEVAQHASTATLHAAGAGIHLLSDDGTALEMINVVGYDQPETRHVQRLPLSAHTPTNTVFNTGQPLWFESPAAMAVHYPELAALSEQLGVRATLQVPIKIEGHTHGVLALGFAEERTFQPEERDLLSALANQCAQALERARLYEAEQQARGGGGRPPARPAVFGQGPPKFAPSRGDVYTKANSAARP
ncbi:MAG: PAS domain S-box protein, partial [Anaerolineales bacterium]